MGSSSSTGLQVDPVTPVSSGSWSTSFSGYSDVRVLAMTVDVGRVDGWLLPGTFNWLEYFHPAPAASGSPDNLLIFVSTEVMKLVRPSLVLIALNFEYPN